MRYIYIYIYKYQKKKKQWVPWIQETNLIELLLIINKFDICKYERYNNFFNNITMNKRKAHSINY